MRKLVCSALGIPLLYVVQTAHGQAVVPCADPNSCAQVSITDATGVPDSTVQVRLIFKQGPDDDAAGGIDEIASLALTVGIPGNGSGVPLQLADCAINQAGLPTAVTPDASISGFNVVVQNAFCTAGRTHCLCPPPASGIVPDNFINLAIYGPKPIPTPGVTPIDIPRLPTGPQALLTIDLRIDPTANGTIPLHIFNAATDGQHPEFAAFLSAGDTQSVDRTVNSSSNASNVFTTDGMVVVGMQTPTPVSTETATFTATETPTLTAVLPTITPTATTPSATSTPSGTATATVTSTMPATRSPSATSTPTPMSSMTPTAQIGTATPTAAATRTPTAACAGDCNHDGDVTVGEILTMVNITLGNAPVTSCEAADLNDDGTVTVNELLLAVNASLNGCP